MSPKVSIGLPVYNGANYLREALDSILSQTFRDFEVVISDNASTDATWEICMEYAAKDPRIRFSRNDRNLGAARNFNRAFELSSGEYFKWAAHDDVLHPDFLLRCVRVLDELPSAVVCFTETVEINDMGNFLGEYNFDNTMNFDSLKPHERFRLLMDMRHWCMAVFGLMRAEALKRSPLIGGYVGSDRCLLAELGLMGQIYRVPESLFFRRHHPDSSVVQMKLPQARVGWFDADKAGRLCFPNWKYGLEYFKSVIKVRLEAAEKIFCYIAVANWYVKRAKWLSIDVITAGRMLLRRTAFGRKLDSLLFIDLTKAARTLLRRTTFGRKLDSLLFFDLKEPLRGLLLRSVAGRKLLAARWELIYRLNPWRRPLR